MNIQSRFIVFVFFWGFVFKGFSSGRVGFSVYCVWVFIYFCTRLGLHSTALISNSFASAFANRGMRAYGEIVQEPEMEQGVEVVTHQKWSGANYADELLKMVSGGVSSTSAMGAGVTEDQFAKKH